MNLAARWNLLLPEVSADGRFVTTAPDRPDHSPRHYGGHLSAMAVWAAGAAESIRGSAAEATPDADRKRPHSVHGYHLRAAVAGEPVTGSVEDLRSGRRFALRTVRLEQNGKLIFVATVSLQQPGPPRRPDPRLFPPAVPGPEQCPPSDWEWAGAATKEWLEVRPVTAAPLTVWMHARPGLPDDPAAHLAALASIADFGLVRASQPDPEGHAADEFGQITGVSLDHALWFHEKVRGDQWLLFRTDGATSDDGRALAVGRIWTAAGTLAATYVQDVFAP